jgi:hypothetical protein
MALAHIDVDWYEPVHVSLERIEPRLSPGGALVIDDYEDWSGCRRAVDEYFSGDRMHSYSMDLSAGSPRYRQEAVMAEAFAAPCTADKCERRRRDIEHALTVFRASRRARWLL